MAGWILLVVIVSVIIVGAFALFRAVRRLDTKTQASVRAKSTLFGGWWANQR